MVNRRRLSMSRTDQPDLTLLFDGGCPLCVREVRFLRGRDRHHRIAFVDIDAPDYNPTAYAGISYRMAMGRIHALKSNGDVLKTLPCFERPIASLVWAGCMPPPVGLSLLPWPILLMDFGRQGACAGQVELTWTRSAEIAATCDEEKGKRSIDKSLRS